MHKIINLLLACTTTLTQGREAQLHDSRELKMEAPRNFLKLNPCFFLLEGALPLTAEYFYVDESGKNQCIIVGRNLLFGRIKEGPIWRTYGPFEHKTIVHPYVLDNQLRFPHTYKPKRKSIQEDIEEIKNLIDAYQKEYLSPKQN